MSDNYPQMGKAFTWTFRMVQLADGYTAITGLTPTVTASLDGAAFAGLTGAPAVSEIANGYYKVIIPVADMVSIVVPYATGAAARPATEIIVPGGDWLAALVGKRVVDRSAQEASFKQSDGATEQFKQSYANVDNDSFSWTPS